MHDLHEANKIIKLVLEEAEKNKFKKVKKIVLGLGDVIEHGQSITLENLKFNMGLLTEGTVADGVEIIIKKSDEGYWKLVGIEGE